MRMLILGGNLNWQETGLSVDGGGRLWSMVEQTKDGAIVGIVLESEEERTLAFAIENGRCFRILHQDCVDDCRLALVLDRNCKRKIAVHIRPRNRI